MVGNNVRKNILIAAVVMAVAAAVGSLGVAVGKTAVSGTKVALTEEERACVMTDARAFWDNPSQRLVLAAGGMEVVDRTRSAFMVRAHTFFRIPFAAVILSCHGGARAIRVGEASIERYARVVGFYSSLRTAVAGETGMPAGGYRPEHFLEKFPGLKAEDFDGVEAEGGRYEFENGEMAFVAWPEGTETYQAPGQDTGTLCKFDIARLLDNISARFGQPWETEKDITAIIERLKQP